MGGEGHEDPMLQGAPAASRLIEAVCSRLTLPPTGRAKARKDIREGYKTDFKQNNKPRKKRPSDADGLLWLRNFAV